ncbi:subtilisin-like protease SBT1.8 [Tanacetum coccineum]
MANVILWLSLLATIFSHPCLASKKTYIVQMNHHLKPDSFLTHHDWYSNTLQSISPSLTNEQEQEDPILYSYTTAYNGFSASLDEAQIEEVKKLETVLGVYEDEVYHLHTTRTPEFLGIENEFGLWSSHGDMNVASHDVIIGVLDTGVWPESRSFDDGEMPSVPGRWKGECEEGEDFKVSDCNKKLIGARKFSKGFRLAAGVIGKEKESPRDQDGHGTHTASTAAGGQVGNASLFGFASGTARGMAVHARVATYKVCWKTGCFGSDILAGMDRAILDGVDVLSMSLGGGSGPYYRDTIAIGAFKAMEMGVFVSCSAGNSGPTKGSLANVAPWIMTVWGDQMVELVYFSGKGSNSSSSNLCMPGSLQPGLVKGKVVFCDRGVNPRVEKGQVVKEAGGVGMILGNTAESGEELVADSHLLPAVAVGMKIGNEIREYLKTDKRPMAALTFGGTVLNVKPSPVVAAFSSRGPNMVTPQILKPDVIGPGVNILAGWSGGIGPTGLETDTRKTEFNIMSAGGQLSTPWAHGAGHVDPHKALSPGLVYDITAEEYVAFVCSIGYDIKQVQAVVNRAKQTDLPNTLAEAPKGVQISVKPKQLVFKNVGDKMRYTVTFVSEKGGSGDAFGSITWKNAENQVRSPVAFGWSRLI